MIAEHLGAVTEPDADGRGGARLAGLVAERELDQLFVSDLVNVRYLTGFTGTNGACLVGAGTTASSSPTSATPSAPSRRWGRAGSGPRPSGSCCPRSPRRMQGRVGFEDAQAQRAPAREARARRSRTGSSWSQPATWSRSCAPVKDDGRDRARSPPPPSSTDEVYRWADRAGPGRPHRARGRARRRGADPRAGRRALVPADRRRRRRTAPCRTPSPGEREIGEGRAGRVRHGRAARRLLLGLHPHLRHRRARRRGARGLRAGPRAPRRRRSRRSGPGSSGKRGRRGRRAS